VLVTWLQLSLVLLVTKPSDWLGRSS